MLVNQRRGVSLIEVLIAIVIIAVAAVGTLSYFGYGLGSVNKQGNRRAALERARQQLEQVMAANVSAIAPAEGDSSVWWLKCTGSPCAWSKSQTSITQNVSVDNLPSQPMETTIQRQHDPAAGTPPWKLDTLAVDVKVWFTSLTGSDDNFNRVYVRTLRTP